MKGHGYLLVYAINSRASFEEIKTLKGKIERVKEDIASSKSTLPIVIIGNKSDLENERQIKTETGEALAREWQCKFFEASAKDNHHIEDSFWEVVREVRRLRGTATGAAANRSGADTGCKCQIL